jgi:hypothetical protein
LLKAATARVNEDPTLTLFSSIAAVRRTAYDALSAAEPRLRDPPQLARLVAGSHHALPRNSESATVSCASSVLDWRFAKSIRESLGL